MTTFAVIGLGLILSYMFINTTPRVRNNKATTTPFGRWFDHKTPKRSPVNQGRMLRCHNCGCFFPESRVISKVIEGHVLEFCTDNCRQNFRYP